MLTWSLRLDYQLFFKVKSLPLSGKFLLILQKYLYYLIDKTAGARSEVKSLLAFGSRFCYNELHGPTSLQRVYCASYTLRELLPDRPVVIDVGANIGQFNFFARQFLDARRVISIEPVRECYQLLLQNARVPVDCLCCAINDRAGELLMHVAQESSQLSSCVVDADVCYCESYSVPARSLDAIAGELGVEWVDLLKIDTEGSEFDVLQSADQLLSRTELILVEMSVFRKSAGNLFRIGSYLEGKGFALVELSGGEGRRPRDLDAVFRRA